MAITAEEVAKRFPIHWFVWNNQHAELKRAFDGCRFIPEDFEKKDPRGRTPLMLAVTLGYTEVVRVLLDCGADPNCETDGWTAVQEATASGDAELLSLVITQRDYQRHLLRSGGIPELLRKLSVTPDFYVEMKWEFTSWVPLVSRMCPFDTYKVYKSGGNVRVDTTLVGFENSRWQRGDRTYIFQGHGHTANLIELDHEAGTVWREGLSIAMPTAPPPALIAKRLAAPIATNYLDTDKISFERSKSGIWGWRQDKIESVNGYECKVFSANNVELVSKTRSEHIPSGQRRPAPRAPLASLLALAETPSPQDETPMISRSREESSSAVSWMQYFSDEPLDREFGRPQILETKVQKFRATLWLCEDYPLQLQQQILPILDLMAAMSSPHFSKLKDFVQMQLPAGFPVKIEIPLFHVLNARITFGNILASESPVEHVSVEAGGVRIARDAFSVPRAYRPAAPAALLDHDDALLQYALEQSLAANDQIDVWEALRNNGSSAPPPPALLREDRQLQRAIEASLASVSLGPGQPPECEWELSRVLALSAAEHAALRTRSDDETRALEEAIRISLIDK